MPATRDAENPDYVLAQIHATQTMVVTLAAMGDHAEFVRRASAALEMMRTAVLNSTVPDIHTDAYIRGIDEAEKYMGVPR